MGYYEKAWAEKWHAEVKINKKERTGDDYKLMGRRFIEDYYKRHHPFDEGRVLGLERYIRFTLAEGEGVQVIAGTDAPLRVTEKKRVVSPAKGSEEREALERELRAAGVWDEVATLDASALEKAVAEEKWADDVLERIKAYISIEKRYTVTLKEDT